MFKSGKVVGLPDDILMKVREEYFKLRVVNMLRKNVLKGKK